MPQSLTDSPYLYNFCALFYDPKKLTLLATTADSGAAISLIANAKTISKANC
ncbi:hypothetical protein [Trichormus azollae]|uniref:hypothetical protein n=1 Tax=Trichormus azollae TaxID=1164 RepID=UPI00325F383F